MVQKGAQGRCSAITIHRVKVGITQQDKGFSRGPDRKIAIQKMHPECSLIRVSVAIPIPWVVKGGGGGVPDQQGERAAVWQLDRQDQMAVRRQALNRDKAGIGAGWNTGLRQIAPEERAEILRLTRQQGQA